jgi:hypothetical protein
LATGAAEVVLGLISFMADYKRPRPCLKTDCAYKSRKIRHIE